jgi:CRISPR-associated protein (TIGR02584 family)
MSRQILFCTIGQTPQVVTETLWALKQREPPWVPDEIHIVTTTHSLERIRTTLQNPEGPLATLLGGQLPPVTAYIPMRNGGARVYPMPSANGRLPITTVAGDANNELIADVRSVEDAAIMGDVILQLMAEFVRDDSTQIHVSLAGGRKTTSAYALLAFALIGRPRDEASHVLVSPPEFEDNPEFWHPGQGGNIASRRVTGSSTEPSPIVYLDPSIADISLISTPTPLLRYEVRDAQAVERLRLPEIVKQINLAATLSSDPRIRLDTGGNIVVAADVSRQLGPKLFAIYRLIAVAWKEQWPGVGPGGYGDEHLGWLSVPQISVGRAPTGKRIDEVLLGYIREAVAAEGGDPDGHMSVIEWRENVVVERSPARRLANAQSALGANTRLVEALTQQFGAAVAAIIAPVSEHRRQRKLVSGEAIRTDGATRFGFRQGFPPAAITIR